MSGDGAEDPNFVKVAGADAAEGAVLSAPAGPPPADFGASGLYATQSYDATNIFLAALDDGASTAEEINDFIGSYTGDGVSGPIAFDENGDIKESKIYAYFVKDGELDVENPQAIS
jgi:branched-chain amino acid transport system substrate-binding protein